MKKTVRLTESQVRRIVTESVRRIISENSDGFYSEEDDNGKTGEPGITTEGDKPIQKIVKKVQSQHV